MLVTMGRDIATRLYDEISKQRPAWHDDDDAKGEVKVVMNEGLPLKERSESEESYQRRIAPLIYGEKPGGLIVDLSAALNTATGEVLGKTAPRQTGEQFVAFLTDMVASQPERREIRPSATTSAVTRPSGSRISLRSTAMCPCISRRRTRLG